jgi:hypothetical protein
MIAAFGFLPLMQSTIEILLQDDDNIAAAARFLLAAFEFVSPMPSMIEILLKDDESAI